MDALSAFKLLDDSITAGNTIENAVVDVVRYLEKEKTIFDIADDYTYGIVCPDTVVLRSNFELKVVLDVVERSPRMSYSASTMKIHAEV